MRVSLTLTSENSYVQKMKFCLFALIYFWKLQKEIYQIARCICPKWKKVFSRLCKVFVINQLHATWHTAFGRHETFTSQHTGTAFENVNIFHKWKSSYWTQLISLVFNIYHSMILWKKRRIKAAILSYLHWLCTKWVKKCELAFRAEIVICCPARPCSI